MTSQSSCVSTTSSCAMSSRPAASRCATSSCQPSLAICACRTPSPPTSRWTCCLRLTRAPDLSPSRRTCCQQSSGIASHHNSVLQLHNGNAVKLTLTALPSLPRAGQQHTLVCWDIVCTCLNKLVYKHISAWRCCNHQHASLVLMALIQLSMLPLSKLCNQAH